MRELILDHLGKDDSMVDYLPEDVHNVQNKRPDISRAAAAFGHNPQITLEEGVPRTIDWMQAVYAGRTPEEATASPRPQP